jgi:acetyltransferase-like isoleucine patch superfamily enzyme
MPIRIHPTADVSEAAQIGEGTSIWHQAQIREGVSIGEKCIIGKGVYIDSEVQIGSNVKIQNYVSVFHGVTIEDGVFIGPHVCFTNDLHPRAVNPDGSLKAADDWVLSKTRIRKGAALGANSTIVCGTTIGAWSMVGAGSVVTRDVPDYGLVWGNPARLHGFVCPCGSRLEPSSKKDQTANLHCPECSREIEIPLQDWKMIHDKHR